MRIYAMSCGRLRCRKNVFVPETEENVFIECPMPIFLITHPKGYVLFDTGPHPDVFFDAASRWGGLAKALKPIGDENSAAIEQLKSLSVSVKDIRYIVNSHLHPDHAGGNQFFRSSKFLIQKREVECAKDPKYEGKGYLRSDWDHPLDYVEIEGEVDIYGDGKLIIIPMFGHTLGHQILLAKMEDEGSVILSGDCVPCRENYTEFKVTRTNIDDREALQSIIKLHHLVNQENAFLIYGHDPLQWGKIEKRKQMLFRENKC